MHLVGKPDGRPLAATSGQRQEECRLFHIVDPTTGQKFLIDTGAQVSVLPATKAERASTVLWRRLKAVTSKLSSHLKAVNGTHIPVYRQRSVTLNLGLRRIFRWVFLVAHVGSAIIGADFLTQHGLLVDVKRKRLIDSATNLFIHGIAVRATTDVALSCATVAKEPFAALIAEFPKLTSPPDWTQPVCHDIRHHIVTSGPPVLSRPRRLAPDKLKVARS